MNVSIENSWKARLVKEFSEPYFSLLAEFVRDEYKKGIVYPSAKNIFKAFDLCPFDKTKVVIIGQDPYHGVDQANGLAFAVNRGFSIPPSLKNIFKEIENDLNFKPTLDGDLSRWAGRGILLLNATLSVRAGNPGSHQNRGWEIFTDAVIEKLSKEKNNLAFLLWGNYAKNKGIKIDRQKHLVLESAHPSPFSANNGFFGNKHFSKTNAYLISHGKDAIDWH